MNTIIKTVDLSTPDCAAVQEAAAILKQGGLVILPTETVYGLGANALDATAAERIYAAKGRPSDNPLIVHIADFSELAPLVREVPKEAYDLADRFWPGPLTIVLEKSDLVPDTVSGGLSTVAVRMPSHPVCQAVIRAAGFPIAAPSANRSGRPSPTKIEHIRKEMDGRVDFMLDGGDCEVGVESTIVSLACHPPRLLRPGGISAESLREVLPDLLIDSAVTKQMRDTDKASAPGMKYRHYAPKAPMTLYRGAEALSAMQKDFDQAKQEGKRVGVLCFSGEACLFSGASIYILGEKENPKEQAHRLFDALRQMDEEEVSCILSRTPELMGIGLAVYNRMLKAAGHHVVFAGKDSL